MTDNSMVTLIAVIVIGLISLGVGTAIGYILAGMRQPSAGQAAPERKGLAEGVRIWREQRSGGLAVEVDGRLYRGQAELNAGQRAALASLHEELRQWLGISAAPDRLPTATGAPARPAVVPPPAPAPAPRPSSETPPTLRATPAIPVTRAPSGSGVQPPSMDLADILSGAVAGASVKEPVPAARSIAAQIDAIVQEQLLNSPLHSRTIKLREMPDGGIVVLVDGERFSGIGEVADPAVRAFLQECVADWERRAGGD